jgi:hypothetical protein
MTVLNIATLYCHAVLPHCTGVLQIYNESIHDLLAVPLIRLGKPAALKLKEDKAGHITVPGLSEVCGLAAWEGGVFTRCAVHSPAVGALWYYPSRMLSWHLEC